MQDAIGIAMGASRARGTAQVTGESGAMVGRCVREGGGSREGGGGEGATAAWFDEGGVCAEGFDARDRHRRAQVTAEAKAIRRLSIP